MHAHMVGDRSIDETAKATVPTPEVPRTAVAQQKGHGITLTEERMQRRNNGKLFAERITVVVQDD